MQNKKGKRGDHGFRVKEKGISSKKFRHGDSGAVFVCVLGGVVLEVRSENKRWKGWPQCCFRVRYWINMQEGRLVCAVIKVVRWVFPPRSRRRVLASGRHKCWVSWRLVTAETATPKLPPLGLGFSRFGMETGDFHSSKFLSDVTLLGQTHTLETSDLKESLRMKGVCWWQSVRPREQNGRLWGEWGQKGGKSGQIRALKEENPGDEHWPRRLGLLILVNTSKITSHAGLSPT